MERELSYLIGVLQGDGCFYKYNVWDKGKITTRYCVMLEAKDIEMVRKAKEIFEKTFNRKRKIYKKSRGLFGFSFHVKTLLEKFKELDLDFKDPPTPPLWINNNIEFFGPYLAGLIDADGSICIKRKLYPQCKVEITSGHFQEKLKVSIEQNLNCKVSIEKIVKFVKQWDKITRSYGLVFLISSANYECIKQYIFPYISIPRKRSVIEKYFNIRRWS